MVQIFKAYYSKKFWYFFTFALLILSFINILNGLSLVGKTFHGFGVEFSLTVTRTSVLSHWTGADTEFKEYARIIAVNDKPVKTINEFKQIIQNLSPNQDVKYTYFNQGEPGKLKETKVKTMIFTFYDFYRLYSITTFSLLIFCLLNLFIISHLQKNNLVADLLLFNFSIACGISFTLDYDHVHQFIYIYLFFTMCLLPAAIINFGLSINQKIIRPIVYKRIKKINFLILISLILGTLVTAFTIKNQLINEDDAFKAFFFFYSITIIYIPVSLVFFILSTSYCFIKSSLNSIEKRTSRIIFTGSIFAFSPYFIFFLIPLVLQNKSNNGFEFIYSFLILIPAFYAYAIVRYKAFDIEIYLRKGLIYSLLTLVLLCGYLISSFILTSLLSSFFNLNEKMIIILSVFISFIISNKLYMKVQALIDKAFYREKLNLDELLESYLNEINKITDKEKMLTTAFNYLEKALNPENIAFYINENSKLIKLKSTYELPDFINLNSFSEILKKSDNVIKLEKGKFIGTLILGKKKSEIEYLTEDKNFLEKFSHALIISLNTVLKIEEHVSLTVENKQLEEKAQFLTELTSNLSHDLKSPLNSSYLIADKFSILNQRSEENSEEIVTTYTVKLLKSLKKINEYISICLDKEMITTGTLNLKFETINLKEIIEESINLHSEFIERKEIAIQIGINNQEMLINVDKVRFEHVLSNIISNAAKYCKTYMKVVTVIQNENVLLEISNDGEIKANLKDKLFDRYTTGSIDVNSGTGLGLYISKQYLDLMSSKIWFNSENNITSFFISLPLIKTTNKLINGAENETISPIF